MVTKKFLVVLIALVLVLTPACTRSLSAGPVPTQIIVINDATVQAMVMTAMASIIPMATPTAMPTATPTVTLAPTETLMPTVTPVPTATPAPTATPGGWCMNRWSSSCPVSWSEVLAVWPQIQAAYRLQWLSLPTIEPVKVYITGSWWTTTCAGGYNGSCVQPLSGYANIDPKDAQVVWDLGWYGNCHYIIFTMCGNVGRQCINVPANTSTSVPPVVPPTSPPPTSPPPTVPPPTAVPVTLDLSVSPNPDSGQAPLTTVVTLTVGGSATGTIHYWLDCANDGSWEFDFESNSPTETLSCSYPSAGNYKIVAQVSRGGLTVGGNATVIVTP